MPTSAEPEAPPEPAALALPEREPEPEPAPELEPDTVPELAAPEEPVVEASPELASEPEAALEAPLPQAPLADVSLPSVLAELEGCTSVASYLELARRATVEAERRGDPASALLVMERFAQHVESKRDRELEVAQTILRAFARGPRLGWLLDKVATGDGSEQLRATQIVAMLGEEVAGELFDRLGQLPDRVQRERIEPLLVALGEQIVPELLQRMQRPDASAVRAAAHVAGLLQHPGTVERLAQLVAGADSSVREEASRALVRIGSDEAVEALARGLRSPQPAVVLAAAQQLGATQSARAVAPLGHALERALELKQGDLARELLRALGRIARADVTPYFASLMRRKAGFGGRWLRELKVAAATALASVPGDQAVALLAEALAMRDDALRRAAQRALDRRAQAVTRAAPSRPVA